jgi:hypothetical protein
MGFLRVHLEGDAKIVVDTVNSVNVDKSWLGHVIEDIKVELKSQISGHNLAKYAVMNCISNDWRDTLPACIRNMLVLEQFALVA